MLTIPIIKNNLLAKQIGNKKISIFIDIQVGMMGNKN